MTERPIERTFPIEMLNETAKREAQAKRYFRPPLIIHKWWARRLGSVFRAISIYTLLHKDVDFKVRKGTLNLDGILAGKEGIDALLEEDDLWPVFTGDVEVDINATVLDPMMGGGTTILEALLLGCNVVGCELHPVAWFIVKKMIEPVDPEKLDEAYRKLEESIAPKIKQYYKTSCPNCGGQTDVMYYLWVNELKCVNCGCKVPLFGDWMLAEARSTNKDFYHVICPKCWNIFEVDNYRNQKSCPRCGHSFNPGKDGNVRKNGKYYICPDCGQSYEIIEAASRQGYSLRLFAIEYYCLNCNLRGYKEAGGEDQELYDEAKNRFEDEKENLPFPDQEKPYTFRHGPRKHGFTNFKDMFNKRQLLCLSKLLKGIMEIKNENVQEFLLLAFSESLNTNSIFCHYGRSRNHIQDVFSTRTLRIRHVFAENNVWGTKYGMGTFKNRVNIVNKAKEFCRSPFQKFVNKKGNIIERNLQQKIEGIMVDDFNDLGDKGNSLLLCRSSDYLREIPNKSIDSVITDPPYYNEVIYSEHSDFYYVWLRLALKDKYDFFRANLTPRKKEAVVTPYGDKRFSIKKKTKDNYLKILKGIFRESHRVLKDDGLMVFTFHHKESKAWSSVLKAVLDAGFYIVVTYPIHSEMSTSMHIYEKQNIAYDTVVVCKKRKKVPEKDKLWTILEDEIYSTARKVARVYEEENGSKLTIGDLGVITKGECLEIFSKNYPRVVDKDGKRMDVADAIERVTEVVDQQLVEERIQELSNKTDKLTSLYLLFIAGKDSMSYDALHRQFKGRPTGPEDFTKHELLKQWDKIYVISPEDRAKFIEKLSPGRRLSIDKAHYLLYLLKDGRLTDMTENWIKKDELDLWIDNSVVLILEELRKVTGNEDYGKVKRHAERCLEKIPQKNLDVFR